MGLKNFISDGIIFLGDFERKGDLIRTLQIVKIRGSSHSRTKYAMSISAKNGVELAPLFKIQRVKTNMTNVLIDGLKERISNAIITNQSIGIILPRW